jgi:hypothetical protein
MNRCLTGLRHPLRLASTSALPLCLLLSACGGGGGDSRVASIPPPPTTLPPPPASAQTVISGYSLKGSLDVQTSWLQSPATRNGNYDLIGRLSLVPGGGGPSSSRTLAPGEFVLSIYRYFDDDPFPYTLQTPAGVLPGGLTSMFIPGIVNSWDINQNIAYRYDSPYGGDFQQDLGQRLTAFDKAGDGSETQLFSYDLTRGWASTTTSLGSGKSLRTTLDYDIGFSYVAMGEWSWRVVDLNGATAGDSGDLLFVNGDRTPAAGIPVSGTATYDAHSLALLGSSGTPGIPFTLTADFGQRTMSTMINQDYRYDPTRAVSDDPIFGIHVSGSAPFSNSGTFDIPLTGTANYASNNSPTTPPIEPVSGMMDGAFFGPHAEDVGGTFAVDRADGTLLMQDAFVGEQRPQH